MRGNTLDIYITDLCNLNCEYCYIEIKKKEDNGFNSNEVSKRINLLEYENIKFFGGEPLIKFDEIKRLIVSVKSKKSEINFSIITNGILLNKEKLDFFVNYKVSLAISLHDEVLKKILKKDFLDLLIKYKNIIGFIILFRYKKEYLGTKIFLFLSKIGFYNFSLSPITTDKRDDISNLEIEFKKISDYIQINKKVDIAESNQMYLKNLKTDNFCKKEQIDKSGEYKSCNRFDKIDFLENNNNIKFIDKLFNDVNKGDTCNNRWFFICNKGWYLDNFGDTKNYDLEKIKTFHKLNILFINFYKEIVKIKNKKNFLTENIQEIRFNLTNQCNLRCGYCYLDFNKDKLDINIGKNIIDYFLEQDGSNKIISFFGGEPLLEFKLLEELVSYSNNKGKLFNKKINYKIATNAILLDSTKIQFLKENNFEIHISFNGDEKINNITRDNSTLKLFNKIELLKKENYDFNSIVLLYVIFPNYINNLEGHIFNIKKIGFKKINFEIYLGNKYIWNENTFKSLQKYFLDAYDNGLFNDLILINLENNFNNYLDISTYGKISDNSLEFFKEYIDFTPKKYLDNIFNKIKND